MIDWARIEELRFEIGEDGVGEVVEIFLEEVEETLTDLGSAQTDEDRAARLHFLKGSALNLGLNALAALCEATPPGMPMPSTDEVLACYAASKTALLAGLGRHAA